MYVLLVSSLWLLLLRLQILLWPQPYFPTYKGLRLLQQQNKKSLMTYGAEAIERLQGKRSLWNPEALERLAEDLQSIGSEDTPWTFKLREWLGVVLILVPGLMLAQLANSVPMIQGMIQCLCVPGAYAAYRLPRRQLEDALKQRREKLLLELPRFIRTLRFSPDTKPLFFVIQDYLKVARSGLSYDLKRVLADLEMNRSQEEALSAWAQRSGLPQVKELCATLGVLESGGGAEARLALLLIENKVTDQSRQLVQAALKKRPERLELINQVLMGCLGALFVVPVLLSVIASAGSIFR